MIYIYASLVGRKSFAAKLARIMEARASKGPFRNDTLINWGRSAPPPRHPGSEVYWLNHRPDVVATVSHKTRCFETLRDAGVRTVEWTTDLPIAQGWLDGGSSVYERHVLTGHSGAGIVLKRPPAGGKVDPAPLYTKRVRGAFREYRVHVGGDTILCVQQKRKMSADKVQELGLQLPDEGTQKGVRTYRNGWVFAINDVEPLSADNLDLAVAAMKAVGAGSGCVDMAITGDGIGHVIEINSAPALRSDTVANAYANYFTNLLQERRAARG